LQKNFGVFHECQVQGFFEILELKFTSVNEHFKISKVMKKLALVKNAKTFYIVNRKKCQAFFIGMYFVK